MTLRYTEIAEKTRTFISISNTGENTTRTKYLILMAKNLKTTDKKLQL